MKRVADITLPLGPDTPIYPGDPALRVALLKSMADGDDMTASSFEMGCHVGTHVDLPSHFLEAGRTLGDYPISAFVGQAVVLELSDVDERINLERLSSEVIPKNRHVLIKTRNSELLSDPQFYEGYVFVEPEAVSHILDQNALSIGIDYYSLDPSDSTSYPAHSLCAKNGAPVFVCLDLRDILPGEYWFAGLPLRINQLEGCPVRAILWDYNAVDDV
jgi:arylformamidase